MSKAKFTPGPWHLIHTPEGQWEVVEPENLCRIVARGHGADAEGNANGFLIAAAPTLYAALDRLAAVIDESEGVVGWHLNGEVARWDREFADEMAACREALAAARGEK